jgi:glucan 1,3-beta-glucosidase
MSRLFALPALGLALGVSFALWGWLGRPVEVPDVPGGRLQCVSYTPWEGSENPLKHEYTVDEAILRDSLAALKPFTNCIRLYSALGPYPHVVRIADELGIDVMLGMWIGNREALNQREIAAALQLAQSHPKAVRLLIVGNEVLLRREMSGNRLAGIIRSVKERTSIPVAYADIPHFWVRNKVVAEAVDVVGIHLLPYWDDPTPTTIDKVQEHLRSLTAKMQAEFPGKPLLMAEVGWPSAGRTRGGAVPSLVNEARFMREFSVWAAEQKLDYNLIEGWDQPWKKGPEGTVGGFWGILDRDLEAKFPLAGPVSEWPAWRSAALFAAALSGLLLLAPLAGGRRPTAVGWLGLGLLGPATGSTLVGLADVMETVPYTVFGTMGTAGLFAITLFGAGLLALHLMGDAKVRTIRPAPFDAVFAWLKRPWRRPDGALMLGIFWWGTMGSAALMALAIAFDGRHRDFPSLGMWIPGLALALHAYRAGLDIRPGERREEAWTVATVAIAGLFGNDWWGNVEGWVWIATCLLLAAPGLPIAWAEALRLARRLFQADQAQAAYD